MICFGIYSIKKETFNFPEFEGTEMGEMIGSDGDSYIEALNFIESYKIKDNQLFLYYTNNKYLLLNRK